MISRLTIPINRDFSVKEIEERAPAIRFFSWNTVSGLLKESIYKQVGEELEVRGIRCTDQGIELVTE